MIGFGVILHRLGGGSKHSPEEYLGQKIIAAELKDNRLWLSFENGKKISIWDDGQSCCESRYMTTNDEVSSLVGHHLSRIEAKEGPEIETDFECHEIVFVEVGTDTGFITLTNHNEHSGYYGGFGLTITEEPTREDPQ